VKVECETNVKVSKHYNIIGSY